MSTGLWGGAGGGCSPLSCFIVPDNDFPIENDLSDPGDRQ